MEERVIPYLAAFFISILLCAAGEWSLQKNRLFAAVFCVSAIIPPVILAGARDYKVGTDITVYGNHVFRVAREAKYLMPLLKTETHIEPLYKALAFAVSRWTNNAHWFYFATALIICACMMAGILYYRRWCSATLAWACFLFLFYGDTLNIMRQSLAIAVSFAAFPLFIEKKYPLYIVLQIAAVMFHVTGVITFCFPLAFVFLKTYAPRWLQFFLIVGGMFVLLFYSPILQIMLSMHWLPSKFIRYASDGIAFALNPTLLRLPLLLPILYYYDLFCGPEEIESEKKEHYLGQFAVLMVLMDACTVQLRSVSVMLYRISLYFSCFRFLAFSRLVRVMRRDNRAVIVVLLFMFLIAVWYYQNVMQGNNRIYPYVYASDWFKRWLFIVQEEEAVLPMR